MREFLDNLMTSGWGIGIAGFLFILVAAVGVIIFFAAGIFGIAILVFLNMIGLLNRQTLEAVVVCAGVLSLFVPFAVVPLGFAVIRQRRRHDNGR